MPIADTGAGDTVTGAGTDVLGRVGEGGNGRGVAPCCGSTTSDPCVADGARWASIGAAANVNPAATVVQQPKRRLRVIRPSACIVTMTHQTMTHVTIPDVTMTGDRRRPLPACSHREARWPSNLSCRSTPAPHSGSAALHRARGQDCRSLAPPILRRHPSGSPPPCIPILLFRRSRQGYRVIIGRSVSSTVQYLMMI